MRKRSPTSQRRQEAPSGLTLACDCDQWLNHGAHAGWSARTIGDRRDWLARLQSFLDLRGLRFDPDGLLQFLLALKSGSPDAGCKAPMSEASRHHAYSMLRALSRWMVRQGMLTANPMAQISAPRVVTAGIRPFEDEEWQRLLAACERTRQPERNTAILMFLADTGVRASELSALRMRDLDLRTCTAIVVRGKGGKTRQVAFGKQTASALWRYLRPIDRHPDDPVFTTRDRAPFNRYSLNLLARRLGKAAGVANVHIHRFRHDAAVRSLRAGAPVFSVMAQLGHSSVRTTQIYVTLADSDVRTMMQSCSPMDNIGRKGRR